MFRATMVLNLDESHGILFY